MSSSEARLQRLLGGDHLASLRRRLRRPFERAPLDGNIESFRIGKLTTEEHAALASLLGRPQRYSSSLQVDVRLVDIAFQNSGIATSLRDALEQLDGPIVHLATTRLRLQTLWSDAIDGCNHPGLIGLLQTSAGMGLLKRLAKTDAFGSDPAMPPRRSGAAASARERHHTFAVGRRRAGRCPCTRQRPRNGNPGVGGWRRAVLLAWTKNDDARQSQRTMTIRSRAAARNGIATSGPKQAFSSMNWRARPCS